MVPEELARAPYVRLVTHRRDGTPVPTPVWAASDGERLYIWTKTDSGKVKRIRNSGRVTVTPCDVRGNVEEGARSVPGEARLLDPAGLVLVRREMTRKYGWRFRIVDTGGALARLGKRPHTGIAVTF
ncbi:MULTISPECIES: PPOX class F420-dependent oxidoreductase [Streptomyces]|uniref:PPOX class F420-dependent oxidoreductase n=2 Tax=Streptomyces TaxID=1883 RepID=A0A3R7F3F7_9ACTN|nr:MULTISPECIES: PPOX class F420-dependent oxidoreductase [Streptomyces]KNE82015.1 pyridoxamine 5'-phosphate oxidase [Streptomyces fradiae]MCC5036204.1 PPOX class F420-dependent oxidoreductase [Streptomyces sp. WAC 00631]MCC9738768.1 PPOX class F420-dependent oxidoreductase [Streptomyces sp. MNU89]OFA51423.1 PPOX class F420-dependent enzyme [Streptomyces fradiae]PQM19584.1 PPOX class F420-dependent oxidoreductase [Streptomyces xinghaiensis]